MNELNERLARIEERVSTLKEDIVEMRASLSCLSSGLDNKLDKIITQTSNLKIDINKLKTKVGIIWAGLGCLGATVIATFLASC